MALFGNGVDAVIISEDEAVSVGSFLVWTCVSVKGAYGCRHTQGGGHKENGAGNQERCSHKPRTVEMLATTRSLERGLGGDQPCRHLDPDFLAPGTETVSAV